MERTYYLPAEWHRQGYIQLTWPHTGTDWNYMLEEVETCFLNLAREIANPISVSSPAPPTTLGHATMALSPCFKKTHPLCCWTFASTVGE